MTVLCPSYQAFSCPHQLRRALSGMMTLVATANMVVNSELVREGIHGFGFFSVTPIGLACWRWASVTADRSALAGQR